MRVVLEALQTLASLNDIEVRFLACNLEEEEIPNLNLVYKEKFISILYDTPILQKTTGILFPIVCPRKFSNRIWTFTIIDSDLKFDKIKEKGYTQKLERV